MMVPGRSADEVTLRAATPEDLPSALALLRHAGLPLEGVSVDQMALVVAAMDGQVVGVAGLERYGTSALLRSVAVSSDLQGRQVATRLVERMLAEARCECIHDVYLRTTSAEAYFPRFGFTPISVEEVPEQLHASVEFQGACPESAVTMKCCLDGGEPR